MKRFFALFLALGFVISALPASAGSTIGSSPHGWAECDNDLAMYCASIGRPCGCSYGTETCDCLWDESRPRQEAGLASTTDFRTALSEVETKRLGNSALNSVFPELAFLGVCK